jgi:curved DNA-binding protein CbpA
MYDVLGLTAGADPGQVKAAFHALAKSSHPDVNAGDANAAMRFKDINAAYEILSVPEKRAAYDLGLEHKHAETHRRVWKAMATTAASFLITVGSGLYFLPSALSAHEPKTKIVAAEASGPSSTPGSVYGFFTLAAKTGLKLSVRALAGTYDPAQLDEAITK